MKTAVCLSLAVLAAAFIASAAGSFCDTADDKVLCAQLIGGAKTWDKAMIKALKGVQKKAAGGKSVADVVAVKLPAEMKAITKESLVSGCHEAYDNIMDHLKDCIGLVKDDPTSALRYYLSAVSYSDCTDGLTEFDVSVAEATQYQEEIMKFASALLAVAQKKPGCD